ncbi:hypothetical protein F4860DRAFT_487155 [Xylaria cubensis]|nr:hypothetical protein F4860DRAFT_487155 [Xylaria cubensis]
MRHQSRNLAPVDKVKTVIILVLLWGAQCFITIPLAVLYYNWLIGLFIFMAATALTYVLIAWADDDVWYGFPFPGPRLTTDFDQSCQNETLEMQPIRDEGMDCRRCRMPYSNSSTYGYCPVNGEASPDDSPPPYSILPAPNNSIPTNYDAVATHHLTDGKPAEPSGLGDLNVE